MQPQGPVHVARVERAADEVRDPDRDLLGRGAREDAVAEVDPHVGEVLHVDPRDLGHEGIVGGEGERPHFAEPAIAHADVERLVARRPAERELHQRRVVGVERSDPPAEVGGTEVAAPRMRGGQLERVEQTVEAAREGDSAHGLSSRLDRAEGDPRRCASSLRVSPPGEEIAWLSGT